MIYETRGGVFRRVNLLFPPKNPLAQMGWIILEPEDTRPIFGPSGVYVTTILLETYILTMTDPEKRLTLEAPVGLIQSVATCREGKVKRINIHNLPSFVGRLSAPMEAEGIGTLIVETANGGDSFVLVEANDLGFRISQDEARDIAGAGINTNNAATEQLGFNHSENPDWKHISFCQIGAPLTQEKGVYVAKMP